ncbi:hypothetical protein B14911_05611 [Bacillus sp. NRRL B-14911]|nr:hypothetical protein B14911_05611 [Bacillus sp. NRRL B-14911]
MELFNLAGKTEAESSNFEHTVTKFSLGLFLPGVFK